MNESKQYDIPKKAIIEAYRKVKSNKGSAGIDGIDFEKLRICSYTMFSICG